VAKGAINPNDWDGLYHRVSAVFTPASPIVERELFSGRIVQAGKVVDAINQPGQHAVLYGERGVGKTSLSNVLADFLRSSGAKIALSKINCDATDTFATSAIKALSELRVVTVKQGVGFTGKVEQSIATIAQSLPPSPAPNDVRLALTKLGVPVVLVFDEFDRLPAQYVRPFTDLVKLLSDYVVAATIVLVGVASTIDQLVKDHASIERAIVQVHLPRMEPKELREIIDKGVALLRMSFDAAARAHLINLSQGLPHYTHLVGLHATRHAIRRKESVVRMQDVEYGIRDAVENAQQSIKAQYHAATSSSHRGALFHQVLLACALAHKDQMSYFQAAEVAGPLSAIMERRCEIPAFARHLKKLSEEERGPVLECSGPDRRKRYRFRSPLLEPYVIMNGLSMKLISRESLAKLKGYA
jgi:Cdc6-like AAA superfamily ATPase